MAQPPAVGAQASRLARDLVLSGSLPATVPKLVYGTAWKRERTADLVYLALRTGFRGVDTAAQPKHYDEQGVGMGVKSAIAEGIVQRKDIFIQTKVTPPGGHNHLAPYDFDAPLDQQVHQSVQSSLRNFTVDDQEPYLDSLVLHSPWETLEENLTVWRTLETYMPHTIRHLGLSNTSLPDFRAIRDHARIKPVIIQNRFHASIGFASPLRAFCRQNGIVFQSFWTVSGNKQLVQSAPVLSVAQKAGVSPVVACYSLVLGLQNITILDGTTNEAHMKEDLEGIEQVGVWSEGKGASEWAQALSSFKALVGDA